MTARMTCFADSARRRDAGDAAAHRRGSRTPPSGKTGLRPKGCVDFVLALCSASGQKTLRVFTRSRALRQH